MNLAEDKFSKLYWQYRQLMFRVAIEILHNQQDAEDALQDSFLKISENLDRISDVDSPRTRSFVVVVVKNICFNKLRRRKHESDTDLDELDPAADCSVEDTALAGFAVEEIERALLSLSREHRDIIYLTAYEELSLPDAAAVLGISYEAAKSRLRRARAKLAEKLEK